MVPTTREKGKRTLLESCRKRRIWSFHLMCPNHKWGLGEEAENEQDTFGPSTKPTEKWRERGVQCYLLGVFHKSFLLAISCGLFDDSGSL